LRLERILSVLMAVINRKRVSAAELAEKLEVSPRTVYRDIEILCQAGFPLVAHQGAGGGFEMMEGYRLDRNALTFDEIASVISALKGMTATLGDERIERTLEKYSTLLTGKEREAALFWQDRLIIDMNPWGMDDTMKQKVALIRQVLENNTIVRFCYTPMNGNEAVREVEPMTLVLKGPSWYLHGYCLLRGDFRLFRLSRMTQLLVTEQQFERREHSGLEQTDWERQWNNVRPVTMVLRFAPQARARVEEFFGMEKLETREDGYFTVKQTYPEDEWVYGFLLSFGDQVEILEPERLRLLIRDRARRVCAIYEQ